MFDIALSPLELRRAALLSRQRRRKPYHMTNVRASLNGLACDCIRQRQLSGYKLVQLSGYRLTTLAGFGQSEEKLALVPVSDRSAIANAVRYFTRARKNGNLSGLGNAEQTQSAVSMSASLAKVGSIVPGIGTVIGAVVGAVVGWLAGQSKPVRPSKAEIAQCQTLTSEFMGFASQSAAPLPLDLTQLQNLEWCSLAIHGAMVKARDPRFFLSGFDEVLRAAKSIVRKVYETPVGATVDIAGLSFKDAKGRQIDLPGASFVNQPFISIAELSDRVFLPMRTKNCEPWGGASCQAFYQIPLVKRIQYEILAFAARTELPNISEADLKAAADVAKDVPGSSARDVVTAVEQVLARNVTRGETSLLLTGQTDTPVQVPGSQGPPVTSTEQIPGMTPQTASDVTGLIKELLAQGAAQQDVTRQAIEALKQKGVAPTPAATQAVKNEVAAQSAPSPWLIGGAALAFVLLAKPMKRGR